MKKFLLVLAVAGFAVACNNDADKKDVKDTTVTVSGGDTVTKITDIDTNVRGAGDTTIKKTVDTDTTKKKDNN